MSTNKEQASFNLKIPRDKPVLTYILIVVISFSFLLEVLTGALSNETQLIRLGAKWNEGISNQEYWRFFTSSLLHGNLVHLLLNQTTLYAFGKESESFYGSIRFFFLIVFSSWSACLCSYFFSPNVSIGASGIAFGVIGSLTGFYFFQRGKILGASNMFKSMYTLVFINLLFGFFYPRIDNFAHIGGLVLGLLFSLIYKPIYIFERGNNNLFLSVKKKNKAFIEFFLTIVISLLLIILTKLTTDIKIST